MACCFLFPLHGASRIQLWAVCSLTLPPLARPAYAVVQVGSTQAAASPRDHCLVLFANVPRRSGSRFGGGFAQSEELIGGDIAQNQRGPARPEDLNFVHLRSLSQPEVQVGVVAAKIAIAAAHFAHLPL